MVRSLILGLMLQSVLLILLENCLKISCVIYLRTATLSNFADTMLKILSVGLRSGERTGILNNRVPTSRIAYWAPALF